MNKIASFFFAILTAASFSSCGRVAPEATSGEGPAKDNTVKVTGISLSKTTLTLQEGAEEILTVVIRPANATIKGVEWTSSNNEVATVSSGKVTAVKAGTALIGVSSTDGGFSDACNLTVTSGVNPENPGDPGDPEDPGNPAGPEEPDFSVEAPEAYGAIPSKGQVEWQKQELIMFYHFGPATFNGISGENGGARGASTLISDFKPSGVDCDQWVRTAKEAGFKEVILTVKHHDGFRLWDDPGSNCDIASCPSPYNVDVVAGLSEAVKKYGINLGIYMSPWDKVTSDDYQEKYLGAIRDLMGGKYGVITEFWLDGNHAADAGIDFSEVNRLILGYNEDVVIFSNVGPGCRWVGNENGDAGETNWSTYSPNAHRASQSSLPGDYGTYLWNGDKNGDLWIPAECDMSIRPINETNGWFWKSSQSPKSASQLMDIFYKSTGRNSIMLCNVPPTTAGVIDSRDVIALTGFREMREKIFGTNYAAGATVTATKVRGNNTGRFGPANMLDADYDKFFATGDGDRIVDIEFNLKEKSTFNRVMLQEYIPLGQRVESFKLYYKENGSWKEMKKGWGAPTTTTIGYKRIVLVDSVTTDAVKLSITSSLACPVLNGFGLYNDTISGL